MNKTLLLFMLGIALQASISAQDVNKQSDGSGSLSNNGQINLKAHDVAFETLSSTLAGKAGTSKKITGFIKNQGTEILKSLTITANDGVNQWEESFSGLNIAPSASAEFELTQPVLLEKGNKEIELTLANPNGIIDQDLANNKLKLTLRGVDLLRPIVVEEGTGTWCGFCVRGHVFMNKLEADYPGYFLGVAVHDGDPMVDLEYHDGFKANAWPTAKVNRDTFMNPSDMEVQFLDMAAIAPTATITGKAVFDTETRILTVNVESTTSKNEVASKFFGALVESGVTGTSSDYNQANYYAGGGLGLMGGYEKLPNPVPASQMVYNHVGRAALGGYNGYSGSIKSPWKSGTSANFTFNDYTIPEAYNVENMHVIIGVLNSSNRFINSLELEIEEAVSTHDIHNTNSVSVSPNPFSENTYASLDIQGKDANVTMNVYNSVGTLISAKDFGRLSGKQTLAFNGSELSNGLYYMQIIVGNQFVTKQLTIVR